MFFTLSGFLIATLLCEECEATGTVLLRAFYERRARRLLPALVAVVLVAVGLTAVTGISFVTWPEVIGALTYSTNVISAFTSIPVDGMLHHTWSLVIEEQFYLVWPLLTLALWRHRSVLLALVGVGAVWAVVERLSLLSTEADVQRVAYGLHMRVDGILIGCGLALVLRGRAAPPAVPGAGAALLVISLLSLAPVGVTFVLGLPLLSAATAVVIASILAGRGPTWLEWRPLRQVGRLSYGLYLWHHVVLSFSDRALGLHDDWRATALVVLPTSVVLTLLSWRYIEQPWLRAKDERQQVAAVASGAGGPGGSRE